MSQLAPDTPPLSSIEAVYRVRALLDALGDALVSWRLDHIEAIEADLRAAVASLQGDALPPLDDSAKHSLINELACVANALTRCRRLGMSLSDLIRFQAYAMGETEGYDAAGEKTAAGATSFLRVRA